MASGSGGEAGSWFSASDSGGLGAAELCIRFEHDGKRAFPRGLQVNKNGRRLRSDAESELHRCLDPQSRTVPGGQSAERIWGARFLGEATPPADGEVDHVRTRRPEQPPPWEPAPLGGVPRDPREGEGGGPNPDQEAPGSDRRPRPI